MRSPGAFDHCVFVDADDLRHAIFAADRRRRMAFATSDLIRRAPEFSSAHRMSAGQILGGVVLLAAGAAGLLLAPQLAYLAVGAVFTAFYLGVVLLRAWLTFRIGALGDRSTAGAAINPEDLPVYSVLIALRDEANQARRLVGALGAIQWPADRLQVLFACEEDDRSTIRALEACNLPRGWRVVACPAGSPKTKPRALTYVLPLVAGEFCVVYDAEDRPHPRQLLEAFSCFHASPDNLACLQAPLLVDNRSPNWLTRMFAMEYRSLFCGQLPVLEAAGGPIPLGGTSNHFRTSILRQSGGWDPYNVTEDADIGIRLARLGHHCGTLRLPTWEEAPRHPGAWMRQRTRWLKGWMQTILVHNRRPMRTLRSLGVKGTILFHLLLGAIVISMISHPLFLAVAAFEFAHLARGAAVDPHALALLGLSVFNLVAGYTTHAAFLLAVANRERVRFRWTDIASLPAYWLLISLAGWRAAVQFLLAPFYWEKTAHGLASRQDFAGIAGNPRRRRQFRQPERRSGSNHPWTTYSTRQPQGN
jgi:cellulose synthase/poly-beta-1,6-N-acetylglucosamine synthase-like glycosyltransferase